uniref:Uncharacterized protein n=1 Tax=Opuntia streptacantha TaxID=393608 RepID=A0A7C8YUI9_OPUST
MVVGPRQRRPAHSRRRQSLSTSDRVGRPKQGTGEEGRVGEDMEATGGLCLAEKGGGGKRVAVVGSLVRWPAIDDWRCRRTWRRGGEADGENRAQGRVREKTAGMPLS